MATPRTVVGVGEVGSLAMWMSALRMPQRQRMAREMRLRGREIWVGEGR